MATETGLLYCRNTSTERPASSGRSNSPLRIEYKYESESRDSDRQRLYRSVFRRFWRHRFAVASFFHKGRHCLGGFLGSQPWDVFAQLSGFALTPARKRQG